MWENELRPSLWIAISNDIFFRMSSNQIKGKEYMFEIRDLRFVS